MKIIDKRTMANEKPTCYSFFNPSLELCCSCSHMEFCIKDSIEKEKPVDVVPDSDKKP